MKRTLFALIALSNSALAVEWQAQIEQSVEWESNPHNLSPSQNAVIAKTSINALSYVSNWRLGLMAIQGLAEPNTHNSQILQSSVRHRTSGGNWRWSNTFSVHSAQRINVDGDGEPQTDRDPDRNIIDISDSFNRWQFDIDSRLQIALSGSARLTFSGDYSRRIYKTKYSFRDNPDFQMFSGEAEYRYRLKHSRITISSGLSTRQFSEAVEKNTTDIEGQISLQQSLASNLSWQLAADIERTFDADSNATDRAWAVTNRLRWSANDKLKLSAQWQVTQPQEWVSAIELDQSRGGWYGVVGQAFKASAEQQLGIALGAQWAMLAELALADNKLDYPNKRLPDQNYLIGVSATF